MNRHRRRKCGHCDQELSYTAFRSHKSLYYDESTKIWIRSGKGQELEVLEPEVQTDDQIAVEGIMDTTETYFQPSNSTGIQRLTLQYS